MNEKKITDDNEFLELKKLLKEIPKIKAPDNFEFNLMTRIQNENFEIKSERKKNIFSWALTPAIAFAATVFIIFFIVSEGDEMGDNPWQTPPQLIQNQISELEPNQLYEKDIESKLSSVESSEINVTKPVKHVAQNLYNGKYPFDSGSSFSLDDDILIKSNSSTNIGETHLAASSTGNLSSFDGFFLREVKKFNKDDSLKIEKDSTSN